MNWKITVAALRWKFLDEKHFLYISYIERKTQPLGTGFNNVACSKTGIILCIDIKRGNISTSPSGYICLNPSTSCSLHIFGISVYCVYYISIPFYTSTYSESNADIFQGGIWFASTHTVENTESMGNIFKGIVKMLYKYFP